jgi:hypothetical protein
VCGGEKAPRFAIHMLRQASAEEEGRRILAGHKTSKSLSSNHHLSAGASGTVGGQMTSNRERTRQFRLESSSRRCTLHFDVCEWPELAGSSFELP